jgi:hypothetical protein
LSSRSNSLADRLEEGARALASLAAELTDAQWHAPVPPDGRTVGVMVHHVASMYPIEVDVARTIASGKPITGLTWAGIAELNAKHAGANASPGRQDAMELLRQNARAAADAIRTFTDQELDRTVPVSLYADAPLTAQFFIEDHAVRHSFHHLAKIRAALQR